VEGAGALLRVVGAGGQGASTVSSDPAAGVSDLRAIAGGVVVAVAVAAGTGCCPLAVRCAACAGAPRPVVNNAAIVITVSTGRA